jgi:hypothetical protein
MCWFKSRSLAHTAKELELKILMTLLHVMNAQDKEELPEESNWEVDIITSILKCVQDAKEKARSLVVNVTFVTLRRSFLELKNSP